MVRIGGRPMDMRMQCLRSIALFQIMKAPLATYSRPTTGLARRSRARISTQFLFSYSRRKCGKLPAPQRVYGQKHNH